MILCFLVVHKFQLLKLNTIITFSVFCKCGWDNKLERTTSQKLAVVVGEPKTLKTPPHLPILPM
ncbi:hypothetical protein GLYMA_03G244901v4 [Glycine max]|nr:hypothetical protein GLYMA_03G244901v4 [Glycine max]